MLDLNRYLLHFATTRFTLVFTLVDRRINVKMKAWWSFKVVLLHDSFHCRLRDRETNWDGEISGATTPLRACSSSLCNCLFPPVNPNSVSGWRVRLLLEWTQHDIRTKFRLCYTSSAKFLVQNEWNTPSSWTKLEKSYRSDWWKFISIRSWSFILNWKEYGNRSIDSRWNLVNFDNVVEINNNNSSSKLTKVDILQV